MNNAQKLILNLVVKGQNANGETLVTFLNDRTLPMLTLKQGLKVELGVATLHTTLRVAESGRVVYIVRDQGNNIAKGMTAFNRVEQGGNGVARDFAESVTDSILNLIGYIED